MQTTIVEEREQKNIAHQDAKTTKKCGREGKNDENEAVTIQQLLVQVPRTKRGYTCNAFVIKLFRVHSLGNDDDGTTTSKDD